MSTPVITRDLIVSHARVLKLPDEVRAVVERLVAPAS